MSPIQTGEKLQTMNLLKVNPEEYETQRSHVPVKEMSRWFLYLSLSIGREAKEILLQGTLTTEEWKTEK